MVEQEGHRLVYVPRVDDVVVVEHQDDVLRDSTEIVDDGRQYRFDRRRLRRLQERQRAPTDAGRTVRSAAMT